MEDPRLVWGCGRSSPIARRGELANETDMAAVTRVRHGWLALAATADNQLVNWFSLDPEPTPSWLPPADTVAAVAADPMRWFDEEHDALMAVIGWDADAVTWALAQRMTSYLEARGHYDDWVAVLRTGLAAADDTPHDDLLSTDTRSRQSAADIADAINANRLSDPDSCLTRAADQVASRRKRPGQPL